MMAGITAATTVMVGMVEMGTISPITVAEGRGTLATTLHSGHSSHTPLSDSTPTSSPPRSLKHVSCSRTANIFSFPLCIYP